MRMHCEKSPRVDRKSLLVSEEYENTVNVVVRERLKLFVFVLESDYYLLRVS